MGVSVKLDIYKTDGTMAGEQAKLPNEVFGIEPKKHAIWLAVNVEMTNRRQGTASTKNRSNVRGGGRKPWRQKGRGAARAGTIRSPLWVGGGRIFGPKPKCYSKQIPKKVSRLARKSVLSMRAKENKILLIEDFTFDTPKTQKISDILKSLKIMDKKTLLLTSETSHSIWLSGRNIQLFDVKEALCFSTVDIMNAEMLLIQKGALQKIKEVLTK
jgi:large subunit ribosomal protein L4